MENAGGEEVYVQLTLNASLVAGTTLEKTTIGIDGQNVEALRVADGALAYVCVTDFEGKNPSLQLFDPFTGLFVKGAAFDAKENAYKLFSITDGVQPPEGYLPDTLELADTTIDVWRDSAREDFYLLLAQNAEGEFGFYHYDAKEQTMQRYVVRDESQMIIAVATPTPAPTPTPSAPTIQEVPQQQEDSSALGTWRTIAIIAIVGCILSLGALSLTIFVQHHPKHLLKHAKQEQEQEAAQEPFPDEAFENDYNYDDPQNEQE